MTKAVHKTVGDSIPVTTLCVSARKNKELTKQTDQSILFILCYDTQEFRGRRYLTDCAISCKNDDSELRSVTDNAL